MSALAGYLAAAGRAQQLGQGQGRGDAQLRPGGRGGITRRYGP